MKLTKEFIKNEIKKMLREADERALDPGPGSSSPPIMPRQDPAEVKKCETNADCPGDYICGAGECRYPGGYTKGSTSEETKQFNGCYDRLLATHPNMIPPAEAREACFQNMECRTQVLEACKQATPPAPAPEQCVDEILVRPTGTSACPPSHEFRGYVGAEKLIKCCKHTKKPEPKPKPKPKPKPVRRGGTGCGRRWISISRSMRGIKVCVLIPSKARRIKGKGKRGARPWDTDPNSYDSQVFAKYAFEIINPTLTQAGYVMRKPTAGFEVESTAGRNVLVAYYDLNPEVRRDRSAKREARKVRSQITRNRKNIWYNIYEKTNAELAQAATTPTDADFLADLDLGMPAGLGEGKIIRIRKKNK